LDCIWSTSADFFKAKRASHPEEGQVAKIEHQRNHMTISMEKKTDNEEPIGMQAYKHY